MLTPFSKSSLCCPKKVFPYKKLNELSKIMKCKSWKTKNKLKKHNTIIIFLISSMKCWIISIQWIHELKCKNEIPCPTQKNQHKSILVTLFSLAFSQIFFFYEFEQNKHAILSYQTGNYVRNQRIRNVSFLNLMERLLGSN